MAQTAKIMRASSLAELEEAIRQAKRYLPTEKSSRRIREQKIRRISEKDFTYCEKTNRKLDSNEAKNFLQPKLDSATDTIDECTSYIDEQERKNRENKDTSHAASIKEGKKRREDCHYQRRLVEFSIDERRAKELCEKVGNMVNANEHTETPGGGALHIGQ